MTCSSSGIWARTADENPDRIVRKRASPCRCM
jgi:hypothetical protein